MISSLIFLGIAIIFRCVIVSLAPQSVFFKNLVVPFEIIMWVGVLIFVITTVLYVIREIRK